MYRRLGLSRDPFGAGDDASLYWESRPRARLRAAAVEALKNGKSVWVSGTAGSGREAFVRAVADMLEEDGVPVVLLDAPVSSEGGVLLALHRRLCPGDPPGDDVALAEGVYAALLDGLWRGGSVLALAAPGCADAFGSEFSLLAGLSFLGRPVVPILAAGEGEALLPGMTAMELPAFSRDEWVSVAAHRCMACGNSSVLDGEPWAESLADGAGIGRALEAASDALARVSFREACPDPLLPVVADAPSLFPSEELDEVGRLLRSLSPE